MKIERDQHRKVAFIYNDRGLSPEQLTLLSKRCANNSTLYVTHPEKLIAIDSFSGDAKPMHIVDSNNTTRYLGQEFEFIVFDTTEGFDVNSFAAITGCLVGGGYLILLLSESQNNLDKQYSFLLDHASKNLTANSSACLLRILQRIKNTDGLEITGNFYSTAAPLKVSDRNNVTGFSPEFLSEQQELVGKIKRVALGHAKRPLVIIADRGRGKSAALGIASAELIFTNKKEVLITAPSKANLKIFYLHFNLRLQELSDSFGDSQTLIAIAKLSLVFISPDNLMAEPPSNKLIIIEEAGALPNQILSKIISKSNRLIFSTTVSGYEGNGRGFEIRFLPKLYERYPQARQLKVYQPIRFLKGDRLESAINDALLLTSRSPALGPNVGVPIEYKEINQTELLQDEALLIQILNILVTAHYQTRPSDLERVLSDRKLKIFVAAQNDIIVSVALTISEGEINISDCEQIDIGKKRLSGHLIPQSMIANQGLIQAGTLSSWRVMRVATIPQFRRKDIASQLIKKVIEFANANRIELVTTSFSLERKNLRFWYKQGFKCIRFGFRKDSSSGNYSAEFIHLNKTKTSNAIDTYRQATNQFNLSFYRLLTSSFKNLDSCLVDICIQKQIACKKPEHDYRLTEIERFIQGARSYEMVEWHLYVFTKEVYSQSPNAFSTLGKKDRNCIIQKVLQQNSWQHITDSFSNTGKRHSTEQLRTAISSVLGWIKSNR